VQESADGTTKWRLAVGAGQLVETVFIPEEGRGTLCVSSQVGCALDCSFFLPGSTRIEVKGRGRMNLMPFAGLIHNYFESYWVVMRGCFYLKKGSKPEKDWLKNIQRLGAKMYRKGEIRRAEALSQSNYQSAIRFLQDEEILADFESGEKGEKKETNLYSLTGNRPKMESLRRKLFKFL
jgi:hypothetical protein